MKKDETAPFLHFLPLFRKEENNLLWWLIWSLDKKLCNYNPYSPTPNDKQMSVINLPTNQPACYKKVRLCTQKSK